MVRQGKIENNFKKKIMDKSGHELIIAEGKLSLFRRWPLNIKVD